MTTLHRSRPWASFAGSVLLAVSAAAWPESRESNVFSLLPALNLVCTPLATASGESGLFSLTCLPAASYFSGESGVFSLAGRESAYDFSISATYSVPQQQARVTAYVYDRASGAIVSSGSGTFRVTQGGQVLHSGSLAYSAGARLWDSSAFALAAVGTVGIQVTVNGRTGSTSLLISQGAPVHLIGWAKRDNGTGISGGTVRLYNAATVFAAANLNSLPAPLASRTSNADGSFDFSEWPVGQYVLTLQTGNGLTVGRTFWLRNGVASHSETIIENPGRTDLLNRMLTFRNGIQSYILDEHTRMMYEVAKTVDGDLDTSLGKSDWFKLLFNVVAGTAHSYGTAYAIGMSSSHFGSIAREVSRNTVKGLVQYDLPLSSVEQYSVEGQSLMGQGALSQPFFAYGRQNLMTEIDELAPILLDDTRKLYDPSWTPASPFLGGHFDRDTNPHRHDLGWFRSQGAGSLGMYGWATDRMQSYHSEFVGGLPALPSGFDVGRAQRILRAANDQMRAISSGAGLIYVSPQLAEATIDGGIEPLALNLYDFYEKYREGRRLSTILERVKQGSGWVAVAGKGIAGGCAVAGSVTGGASLPFAAGSYAVGEAAGWVGFGASVIQAPVVMDMGGTYAQMSAQHNASLAIAPLALKRTQDYIAQEAATPYYLNSQNQFGGEVQSLSLEGAVNMFGRSVYFPIRLQLLPFAPPIEMTGEQRATVNIRNLPGRSTARFRVESRIVHSSGVYNHVVVPGGELAAGQSASLTVPFMGYMSPNNILRASTLETRLWTGPFQSETPRTRQFYVVPINFNWGGVFSPQQEAEAKSAMMTPLSFVKSENEPLSGENLLELADRVRETVETNLVTGASEFVREYFFTEDVFSAEFRLYRPVGASVTFRVEKDGEYIGWDEAAGVTHMGFPGEHSGNEANPETITVPNIGGQTVTVRVALGDVETDGVNVLLEVWEQPVRSAVLAVLPSAIESVSGTGTVHVVEIGIGESSHQHPLEAVNFTASPLRSASGTVLNWSKVSWAGETNIVAGGLKTCSMELDTHGVPDGTYTGTVTVSSASAGTVEVPVSITIDGQGPTVTILPIREWWHRATGPVVSWIGQDNVTDEESLLFSKRLTPVDGSWSGYHLVNSRDMTDLPDGEYLLSVMARDQALNVSDPAASVLVRIDREGNQFLQRIVGADPDITDVSQVNWHDDWDGDNVSNWLELLAGTDPTNSNDVFAFNALDPVDDGFVIRWKAKRGVTYQVRKTTDLVKVPWTDAPSGPGGDEKSLVTAPADGELIYRDTSVTGGAMVYKIEVRD